MKQFLVVLAIFSIALVPLEARAGNGNGSGAKQETADKGTGRFFRTLLSKVGITPRDKTKSGKNSKDATQAVSYSLAWLDSLPKAKGDAQWACLSEALYFEARGETVKGQFAVAEVISNRVKSSLFPASYCSVIHQGTGRKYQCQFTYTCDGYKDVIHEHQAYARVSKVARVILDGAAKNLTDGATYYHTTAVRPSWARRFKQTAQIGVHLFYRRNYRTAQSE